MIEGHKNLSTEERKKEYRKRYYEKHKEERRIKNIEWRKNNQEWIKKYAKSPCRIKASKNWKNSDPVKRRKIYKQKIDNLSDEYVISVMHTRTKVSKKIIRQYPDWIESYRKQIQLKRLITSKKQKNEQHAKTS